MDLEAQRKRVIEAWRAAASALSIRIEAPYLLKTPDGREIMCTAHLPEFGGPRGMVLGLVNVPAHKNDSGIRAAAEALGLYYSFINPEIYGHYDKAIFIEALADWGFFGDEDQRPSWLPRP
jgi:hypothetical protein